MGYKRSDLPSTGGDYFKAASPEFADKAKPYFTVSGVEMVHFEARKDQAENDKLVLSFEETDKLLPLNFSNADILFEELNEDTDEWVGHLIQLYVGNTKLGPGVKVKVPAQAAAPAPTKPAKSAGKKAPAPPAQDDLDDDDEYA